MSKDRTVEKSENTIDCIKILYLDRDSEDLDRIGDNLEESKGILEVIKAENAEEALNKLSEEDIDCVLSSFRLTETNGLEFLEEVREVNGQLPFMLLTEEKSEEITNKAISNGVTECFPKNFEDSYEILSQRIENSVLKLQTQKSDKIRKKDFNMYKNLVETASESMMVLNPELKIIKANKAIKNITELEPNDIEGKNIEVFREKGVISKEEYDELQEKLKTLINDEKTESSKSEIEISVKGSDKYVELSLTKFYDENGELAGLTSIGRDVTDIEEKRRTNRQRLNEFSSLVSHDLRNPLNLAQGYLDLARETGDDEDYHVIEKAHNRMERIIDELLIITSQEDEISKADFSLEDAFEEAYYFAGEQSSDQKVEGDTEIYGDRTSAISMFENLISNSVHHNEKPVEVRVGATENGFYYEDDGKGIPEDKRDRVFEYGYSSSDEGRGLGLSIVKRIAEANDWDFELSESEEGGMRIEFETS